jgi:hypothetical protein
MNRSKLLMLAAAALVAGGAAAQPRPPNVQPLTLTEQGVVGVRLGRTLAQVRATGRIGPTRPGCELVSPRPRFARLRAPLNGFATFGGAAPHWLVALDVRGGAQTERHVAVGASSAAVKRAYPEAHLLTSKPSDPLQLTAWIVKRGGKDRIWFMLNRPGGGVTDLAVPSAQGCE